MFDDDDVKRPPADTQARWGLRSASSTSLDVRRTHLSTVAGNVRGCNRKRSLSATERFLLQPRTFPANKIGATGLRCPSVLMMMMLYSALWHFI